MKPRTATGNADKKRFRYSSLWWLVVCLLLLAAVPVLAQSGGGYDLTWNTIDGGGWTFSQGEGFSLGGTVGQPDAAQMAGGTYTLEGGFWVGGAPVGMENSLYLPLVMRGY